MPLTGSAMGSGVFYGDSIKSLTVPCGSFNEYKGANQWNSFNITVSDKSFSISCYGDTVIPGSPVTYTTQISCLSTTPTLQWNVNGKNAGTGDTVFSYIPAIGDSIKCIAKFKDINFNEGIQLNYAFSRKT